MELLISLLVGAVIALLVNLNRKVGALMAKFTEVDANMDTLSANVTELIREVGLLVAAGPGVITQEQLDSLNTKIQAVATAAKAADPNP